MGGGAGRIAAHHRAGAVDIGRTAAGRADDRRQGKGQDFSLLRATVAAQARALVLLGQDKALIAEALHGTAPIVYAQNMEEAVHHARTLAQKGDRVLLSPFCASLDMYHNYEHRGLVFVDCVRKVVGA